MSFGNENAFNSKLRFWYLLGKKRVRCLHGRREVLLLGTVSKEYAAKWIWI